MMYFNIYVEPCDTPPCYLQKFTRNRNFLEITEYYFVYKLDAQWGEPVSLIFHSALRKLYTEPPICGSYQIAVQLAALFQRRILFRNQPIRNKNCLWWPCFVMNWADMRNRYR